VFEPGALSEALAAQGVAADVARAQPVGGGCIHGAWRLEGPAGPVFLKTNRAAAAWMLEGEADGLRALRAAGCIRVPRVLGHGTDAGIAWLALEWLALGRPTPVSERALGEGLARQHRVAGPHFGWHRDNALGSSPQPNAPAENWSAFFGEQRIGFQLALARRQGLPRRLLSRGAALLAALPELLADRRPAPALLHGDLWGGNRAADADGGAVVFDPAVHYGDPECDLAMTRLFGSFDPAFYEAYDAVLPPAPGRAGRLPVYQLYHVLNHANLFGGGYVSQAERIIDRLLG